MLSLLSRTKSFRDPWVGQPALNQRWQLHRRRLQLAESLCRWRRWLRPVQERQLARDGFLLLPSGADENAGLPPDPRTQATLTRTPTIEWPYAAHCTHAHARHAPRQAARKLAWAACALDVHFWRERVAGCVMGVRHEMIDGTFDEMMTKAM